MSRVRKFMEENKNEPVVMGNDTRRVFSTGLLFDSEMRKELMVKESECCIKEEFLTHTHVDFFLKNGEVVDKARADFSEFFCYENMKVISQNIHKVTERTFRNFLEENLKEESGKARMKLKIVIKEVFVNMVNEVLFGEDEEFRLEDGRSLVETIEEYIKELFQLFYNPLHLLSLDYLHEFGILKRSRDAKRRYVTIEDACWKLYKKRLKEGPKRLPNILDL